MKKVSYGTYIIPCLFRKLSLTNDLKAFHEIREFLTKNKFDLVHSNGPKAGFLFRKVCNDLNIRNVYTHHLIVYKQFNSIFNPLYRFLEKAASNWCDYVITVSQSNAKQLIRDGVTPNDKLVVVYNGLSSLQPKYTREYARKTLGINANDFVVTTTMRLEPPKDPKTLILGFERFVAEGRTKNSKLYIVGDGPQRTNLEKLVKALKIDGFVVFTGFQREPELYLAASDVFLLTTFKEGLPISILEAMKYSLPIIATRVDGIPEQVEDGSNGFLVSKGDLESLCDRLCFLYDNETLRKKMGEKSYAILEGKFNLERNFSRLVELYKELVS